MSLKYDSEFTHNIRVLVNRATALAAYNNKPFSYLKWEII